MYHVKTFTNYKWNEYFSPLFLAFKNCFKYVGFVIHGEVEKDASCSQIVQNPFEFEVDLVIPVTFV